VASPRWLKIWRSDTDQWNSNDIQQDDQVSCRKILEVAVEHSSVSELDVVV
jgi:hypothetical protein